MEQEGLSHLNTLVLVTPKLDIEQAVGRIRESNLDPLIIDIVDNYSLSIGQRKNSVLDLMNAIQNINNT